MRRKNNIVRFKEYSIGQQFLLPPSLDELIPENHLVRMVNQAIERMNIEPLLKKYKGGGTSSYHPSMMLKVLVYAYSQRIYSSRMIAKALKENIQFMWISGKNTPDFRTINRFRSSVMKGIIDEIFASVIELLMESKLVKLENYFLDGTKIEANANKYSWVWGKSTGKNKKKLQGQIRELLEHIDDVNEEENRIYGDKDLEEVGEQPFDLDLIDRKMKELNEKLKAKEQSGQEDKGLKQAVKKLETDCLPRLKKYEEQESILAGRNSYSKTDTDATFMRMKEDHMKNGQLKPGYNVQIGTEEQYVVGFSIHQKAGDTTLLIPHLNSLEKQLGKVPANIIADAGYGSEENYEYLEEKQCNGYVKYNNFHFEQTKKFQKNRFRVEHFTYQPNQDKYLCPEGKSLYFQGIQEYASDNGYKTERRIYSCSDCHSCQCKELCTTSKYGRTIQVSFRLNQLRDQARDKLLSEEGKRLRSKRPVEVESVFGRFKNNWGVRRFLLRGMEKVKVEWGLLCIAHNLTKMATA